MDPSTADIQQRVDIEADVSLTVPKVINPEEDLFAQLERQFQIDLEPYNPRRCFYDEDGQQWRTTFWDPQMTEQAQPVAAADAVADREQRTGSGLDAF